MARRRTGVGGLPRANGAACLRLAKEAGMYVVAIEEDQCDGCGACVRACPTEALVLRDGAVFVQGNTGDCRPCLLCEEVCSADTISVIEV